MTDAVAALPAPDARPRGSFWWGLPIAVGCVFLGHMAGFAVEALAGRASGWPLAAFASPFVAWSAASLLRGRWLAFAGSIVFPIALAVAWIFVVSPDMGC